MLLNVYFRRTSGKVLRDHIQRIAESILIFLITPRNRLIVLIKNIIQPGIKFPRPIGSAHIGRDHPKHLRQIVPDASVAAVSVCIAGVGFRIGKVANIIVRATPFRISPRDRQNRLSRGKILIDHALKKFVDLGILVIKLPEGYDVHLSCQKFADQAGNICKQLLYIFHIGASLAVNDLLCYAFLYLLLSPHRFGEGLLFFQLVFAPTLRIMSRMDSRSSKVSGRLLTSRRRAEG